VVGDWTIGRGWSRRRIFDPVVGYRRFHQSYAVSRPDGAARRTRFTSRPAPLLFCLDEAADQADGCGRRGRGGTASMPPMRGRNAYRRFRRHRQHASTSNDDP
jgi:hypothetical protein